MRMSKLLRELRMPKRRKRIRWPRASDVEVAELRVPGE